MSIGYSSLLLSSKVIVALFTFSYNVNEYIGLPNFDSKSFLVFILKTDSIARISISCSVIIGTSPCLYLEITSLPILLGMPTNLMDLSERSTWSQIPDRYSSALFIFSRSIFRYIDYYLNCGRWRTFKLFFGR